MIRKSACSIALLMALMFAYTPAVHAQGKWKQGQPIPQGANEVIGAAVGNELLVYGGQDSNSKPLGVFYAYDPAKNALDAIAVESGSGAPRRRRHHRPEVLRV